MSSLADPETQLQNEEEAVVARMGNPGLSSCTIKSEDATTTTETTPTAEQTLEELGITPRKPSQGNSWKISSPDNENDSTQRKKQRLLLLAGILVLWTIAAGVAIVVVFVTKKDDEAPVSSMRFANPSTVTWQRRHVIDDPNVSSSFAKEIDISHDGTRLLVSGYSKFAHVYHLDNATNSWKEYSIQKNDSFIFANHLAMAPDGNSITVTAMDEDNERHRMNAVHTYVYNVLNDQWEMQSQIIREFTEGDGIKHLDISENGILAVGSPQHGVQQHTRKGMIRVFQRAQTGPWQLQERIEGQEEDDYVGNQMLISADGSTLVSSNLLKHTNSGFNSGLMWVWRRNPETNNWDLLGDRILGSGTNDWLGLIEGGLAISRNGNVIAALAFNPWGNGTAGALVYDFVPAASPNGGSWQVRGGQATAVPPIDKLNGNGICLSADGSILVAGNSNGVIVQQYNTASKIWERVGNFQPTDTTDFAGLLRIACTPDVRTIATGRMMGKVGKDTTALGALETVGKVVIWTAVESSDRE